MARNLGFFYKRMVMTHSLTKTDKAGYIFTGLDDGVALFPSFFLPSRGLRPTPHKNP
jgi:hypothetical protein